MNNKRQYFWIIIFVFVILFNSGSNVLDAFQNIGGGYIGSAKQVMDNLNIDAVLTASGDMQVTETWKVNLKDRGRAYHNLYLTLETNQARNQTIDRLSVFDVDAGIPYTYEEGVDPINDPDHASNTCYISNTDEGTEIGWFLPQIEEGVRTFRISYTVHNMLEVHKDTAVLYRQFVGSDFTMPVTKLNGSVTLPKGAKISELRAWLHCTTNSNLIIASDDKITFSAEKLPAKTMAEIRLCAPTRLFPAAKLVDNTAVLSDISKQEQQWADEWAAKQRMNYILGIVDAAAGFILLLAGIILLLYTKLKMKRYTVEVPEYTREIPPGNSPGGVANLFYFYNGGVSDDKKGRIFSATMLSLARKGYVLFEQSDKASLQITPVESVKNIPLTISEKCFYDVLRTVAEDYAGSFTMTQFEAYGEEHCKYIDRTMNEFFTLTKHEIADRGYYEKKPLWISMLSGIGIGAIILAVVLFMVLEGRMVYLPLGLVLGGILLMIAGISKQKLSKQGEYDYGVWHGLKKYMLEFSRMKEYGVPQLALWEEYLVYATMMDISKQVCEQIKMAYPQFVEEDALRGNPFLFYTFYGHHLYGGIGAGDFSSSLGRTFSNASEAATRLAHPPTSSNGGLGGGSFGGGGFGGGGFGGGGGGMGGGGGAR